MFKVSSAPQSSILLNGPGGVRAQTIQACLPSLTPEQLDLVNKAKKYAVEQSVKGILLKQTSVPSITPQAPSKTSQRHQALILMCRVYVGSISFELKEESIKTVFSPYGAIKSTNMSWDPVTLKHKGFAFVEYELPEAAQLALEHMHGIQLGGRQIKVGRPSNMPQAAPVIQQIQEECKEKNRIYVSNVHPDLSEEGLTTIFDPFGVVRSCKLAITPNVDPPQHRGYGFIEFETEAAANESLTMNNLDLGGQTLHVCRATTPAENLTVYGTLDSEQGSQVTAEHNEEDIQLQLERANKEQDKDDIRSEGIDSGLHTSQIVATGSIGNFTPITNGHNQDDQSLSNVIVLRNMVNSDDELDDGFHLDVYQECGKHGSVLQVVIYIDKYAKLPLGTNLDSTEIDGDVHDVKIFVKYADSPSSQRAREALNGRYFGGRRVSAEHYDKVSFRSSDYSK